MTNLLQNPGFEREWENHQCLIFGDGTAQYKQVANVFAPRHWRPWWVHDPGRWDQPEGRDAWASQDPHRARGGAKGYLMFTYCRNHWLGLYQQVQVSPGQRLRFSIHAHAWSNQNLPRHEAAYGDGRWSCGWPRDEAVCVPEVPPLNGDPWNDAKGNFTFRVGIDPTGGTDPRAYTVVWGPGAHIYNTYAQVPPVETVAQGETVTVFVESKTLWAFEHNDAYFDDAELVVVEDAPPEGRGVPREQYERTYVLLPPGAAAEWADAVVAATWNDHRFTLGGSADDAGIGDLDARRVIAVNPGGWDGDLEAWFAEHYPGVEYVPVEAATPAELGHKLSGSENPFELWQLDPAWKDEPLGGPNCQHTIGERGCFITGLAWALRKLGIDGQATPLAVQQALGPNGFYQGGCLALWSASREKLGVAIRSGSAAEAAAHLAQGLPVLARVLPEDPEHFVCVESIGDGDYWVMDPQHGDTVPLTSRYSGVQSFRLLSPVEPPAAPLLVGLHDEAGGDWMIANGVRGVCPVHAIVQEKAITLDLRRFQDAGITTICRLNWDYGATMPPPGQLDQHLAALSLTMCGALGVDYFHPWNEPNNKGEWPDGFALSPEYVIVAYNRLCEMIGGEADGQVKIGLPPLDPYFGPSSNNMDWWQYFLANANRMDAIFLHGGKTQDNNPASVWSDAKFADWPLQWQYLHARSIEPYLAAIPERWRGLPVFCTEVNPQRRADGSLGWEPGNAAWVHEACKYLRGQGIAGAVFYRYDEAGAQAPFGLIHKPAILQAIAGEAQNP